MCQYSAGAILSKAFISIGVAIPPRIPESIARKLFESQLLYRKELWTTTSRSSANALRRPFGGPLSSPSSRSSARDPSDPSILHGPSDSSSSRSPSNPSIPYSPSDPLAVRSPRDSSIFCGLEGLQAFIQSPASRLERFLHSKLSNEFPPKEIKELL